MKKITLFLFAMILTITQLNAQITITESDMPAFQTKYLMYRDTTPSQLITPGNAGANQTWNFASAFIHQATDTLLYIDPATTPYGSDFTNSNLCLKKTNQAIYYSYFNKNSDSLNLLGQNGYYNQIPTPITAAFDPTLKIMKFPTTYLTNFTTTSGFSKIAYFGQTFNSIFVDSVKVKDITTANTSFDAYGSITIPLGTYQCLRSVITRTSIDTIWIKSISLGGQWTDVSSLLPDFGGTHISKLYSWQTTGIGYNLLEMYVDANNDTLMSVSYLGQIPQGISEIESKSDFQIFPNPATDVVYVFSNQIIKEVVIFNAIGESVKTLNVNDLSLNVNIADLTTGAYYIKATDQNNNTICTKKFIKQ